MKRILFLALLICAFVTRTMAQTDYVSDSEGTTTGALWTEVGVTKVLPYNLSLGLDLGFRTNDWFDEASRADVGLGLDWKPSKHWKFGVGYTFLMKHSPVETAYKSFTEYEWKYRQTGASENTDFTEFMGAPTYTDANSTSYTYKGFNQEDKDYTRVTDAFWRAKHRFKVDASYTYKFWKWFRVSVRERYQFTYVPSKTVDRVRTGTKTTTKYREPLYDSDNNLVDGEYSASSYDDITGPTEEDAGEETEKEKSSKSLHTLRSRLTLEVDKKGWAWSPYVYVETFNDLTRSLKLDKIRASIGVDYAISQQHKVGVGYVFNQEDDDDGNQNIHAISVGYKFKF